MTESNHKAENGEKPPGRHQGEWPRCQTCGAPENNHPYRHPFKRWEPSRGRAIPPVKVTND